MQIVDIDGARIPIYSVSFGDHAVNATAGKHTANVWYRNAHIGSRRDNFVSLVFDLEADQKYVVRAGEQGDDIYVWIENTQSGEVIARGIVPGEE